MADNKRNRKLELKRIFALSDGAMDILGIPEIELIDGNPELWKYVRLDKNKNFDARRKYIVSTYARVYNVETWHLLAVSDGWSSNVAPYKQVSLYYDDALHSYLLHRLVALAFIERMDDDLDMGREFVNHKDGNPSHNYVWNLEWVTASENMQHAVDTGLWKLPLGEKRSTAKWTDAEIHLVCKLMAEGHKAKYIYTVLGDLLKDPEKVKYDRVHTLYKHIVRNTHWKHISRQYDIDHSAFNYAKETASVTKKREETKQKAASVTGGV